MPNPNAPPRDGSPRLTSRPTLRSVLRSLALGLLLLWSLAAILPAPLKRRPERMNRYSGLILERMSQVGW